MNAVETPTEAVIYARLSYNPDGTKDSVDSQTRIMRNVLTGLGHTIGQVFTDDNKSAWNEDIVRPGWEALLTHLDATPGAVLGFRHVDRLTRNGRDSERLLSVGKRQRVTLVTADGAVTNLARRADRFTARILGAVAQDYSDGIQENVRRAMRARRAKGVVDMIGFGWTRGPGGTVVQNPAEVAIIREVAAALLSGASWADVLRPIADRGVRTRRGRRLDAVSLRRILLADRTRGLVLDEDGSVLFRHPGVPPLDEETFAAVGALLASRDRRGPSQRQILSGLMACGRCGTPMTGATVRRRRADGGYYPTSIRYQCSGPYGPALSYCGNAITGGPVDELVRDVVIEWQADARTRAGLGRAANVFTDDRVIAEAAHEAAQQVASDLFGKYATGMIPKSEYDRYSVAVDARVRAAAAEVAILSQAAESARRDLVHIEHSYDAASTAEKRAMIRLALVTPIICEPTVPDRGVRNRVDLSRIRVVAKPRG